MCFDKKMYFNMFVDECVHMDVCIHMHMHINDLHETNVQTFYLFFFPLMFCYQICGAGLTFAC